MMGFEILILVAIVVAVVALLSRRPGGSLFGHSQSAKEILDARLARGEISPEEYKKLLETLGTR